MSTKLHYVIKFVADMDRAVQFYRDTMGFNVKFQSPHWSEFATGETQLALHPATAANPAGTVQLGFSVPDIAAFYQEMRNKGVKFTKDPTSEEGARQARFLDAEGN